jgi:hypothetical protein
MKKLIIILILLLSNNAFAQKKIYNKEQDKRIDKTLNDVTFNKDYNQYIEVRMKNKTKVVVACQAAPLLLEIKDLDLVKVSKDALAKYKELKDSKTELDAVKVIYTENMNTEITWPNPNKKTLEIKPSINQNKKYGLMLNDEILQIKSQKDTLELRFLYAQLPYKYLEKVNTKKLEKGELMLKISYILNDINDLDSLDLDKIKSDIDRHIESVTRFGSKDQLLKHPELSIASASNLETNAMHLISEHKQNNHELSIDGTLGISLIRDKVAPELNLNFMIRNNSKFGYGIGINQLYFWQKASEDRNYFLQPQNFVSVFFNIYSIQKTETRTLSYFKYRIELGYLIAQRSTYFLNNTFKLGMSMPLSKKISLQPQLFFNGFFIHNPTPSLKLQIGI